MVDRGVQMISLKNLLGLNFHLIRWLNYAYEFIFLSVTQKQDVITYISILNVVYTVASITSERRIKITYRDGRRKVL